MVETKIAVFERPIGDRGTQQTNSTGQLHPPETVHLNLVLQGRLPDAHKYHVVPRSSTSFAVVQTLMRVASPLNQHVEVDIRVFSFTFLDKEPSFEEIGSATVPGGPYPGKSYELILPTPLIPARYVLGVLDINQSRPDIQGARVERSKLYAIRIDFSDPAQTPTSESECQISFTRMHLAPAVDEFEERTGLRYFDHFSGKVLLTARRRRSSLSTSAVIDYLSPTMYLQTG